MYGNQLTSDAAHDRNAASPINWIPQCPIASVVSVTMDTDAGQQAPTRESTHVDGHGRETMVIEETKQEGVVRRVEDDNGGGQTRSAPPTNCKRNGSGCDIRCTLFFVRHQSAGG